MLPNHDMFSYTIHYKSHNNVVYSGKYPTASHAELLRLEVMPDHVHRLVEVDPQDGMHRLVRASQGRASRLLRQEYPWRTSRLPTLWTNSSCVSTVGGAPLAVIQPYLEIKSGCKMLQRHRQRRLHPSLLPLTGVGHWAIPTIEQEAKDGISYRHKAFHTLRADHGKKRGIPRHTLQGMLATASTAWQRCEKKLAKQPRRTGQRNKLTRMPFPDPFKAPEGMRIHIPGLGPVRFHTQALPPGRIKNGRISKRASGWYLCLCIDAQPQSIPHTDAGAIGIDPGFQTLLTLSTGEKMAHPHELRQTEKRLAQAQRGGRKARVARLQERLANQRKDRNHQLSRRLVA